MNTDTNRPMTPSAQHGEPWTYEDYENGMGKTGERAIDSSGNLVMDNEPYYPHPVDHSHMKRATDCVNALRSVANPPAVEKMLKDMAENYGHLPPRLKDLFDATQY